MRATRSTTFGVLIAVGSFALTACSGSGSSGSSAGSASGGTIRIVMNNSNDSLPIVVARQEGFFTKHGLKVSARTTNDVSQVPSLLGKQYDIGFSVGPIMIRAAAAGVPIVVISGNDGDSPESEDVQVFARKGITSVSQLKGKRIGSPTLTGNVNIATKAWLAKNGVDPDQEKYVQVATPNMLDQLKGGQVDAVELIPPFLAAAKQAGFTGLGDPERALTSGRIGGTYWTADSSWVKANPKQVTAFRAALQDAAHWIQANPAKAYQTSASYTKVGLAQAKLSPLGPFTTDVSAADLKIWGDAMRKYGDFNASVDYSKLVNTGAK